MLGGGGLGVEILGPDAEGDCLPRVTAQRLLVGVEQGQADRWKVDGFQARRAAEAGIEQIHRRTGEKACNEGVDRMAVDLQRRPDLDDPAVAHDADPLAHGHRLDLVMRDMDDGLAQHAVKLDQLRAHRCAQLGIQVGERLVEEERHGVSDQRAAQCDSLLLPAAQLSRAAFQQVPDAEHVRRRRDAAIDFLARELAQLEAEGEVSRDAHMRIKRVVLEDDRKVALRWIDIVDRGAVDPDLA